MPWLVGLDVLARDAPTADLVDELVAPAGFGSTVILMTANWPEPPDCLMWRYSTDSTFLVIGLAVGDLRLADGGLDAELAQHAVDQHLEVQLAHAGDDGLAGLLVGADAERRVLVGQRLERLAELVLVGLGLGLDGDVDHRLGEDHPLEDDRVSRSHSVSPVVVSLKPRPATMSPAIATSRSSRWLACIRRMRPRRSRFSLVEL